MCPCVYGAILPTAMRSVADRCEDAVSDARVQVDVAVEGRAEEVDEGDDAEPRARSSRRVVVTCRAHAVISSRSTPVEKNHRERGDSLGSAKKQRSRQLRAPPLRHGDHPPAHGHRWDYMIDSGVRPSAPCVGHCTTDRRLFPCMRTPPQIPGRSPYT